MSDVSGRTESSERKEERRARQMFTNRAVCEGGIFSELANQMENEKENESRETGIL